MNFGDAKSTKTFKMLPTGPLLITMNRKYPIIITATAKPDLLEI